MFLFMSILAIGLFAWVQYRLLPLPAKAPEGLGMVVACMLMGIFGAFLLYLAYYYMMVGEWTSFPDKHSHVEHVITRDVDPGLFWSGIAARFVLGAALIGSAITLPFLKRA